MESTESKNGYIIEERITEVISNKTQETEK
jgi:hypothetical protein